MTMHVGSRLELQALWGLGAGRIGDSFALARIFEQSVDQALLLLGQDLLFFIYASKYRFIWVMGAMSW